MFDWGKPTSNSSIRPKVGIAYTGIEKFVGKCKGDVHDADQVQFMGNVKGTWRFSFIGNFAYRWTVTQKSLNCYLEPSEFAKLTPMIKDLQYFSCLNGPNYCGDKKRAGVVYCGREGCTHSKIIIPSFERKPEKECDPRKSLDCREICNNAGPCDRNPNFRG